LEETVETFQFEYNAGRPKAREIRINWFASQTEANAGTPALSSGIPTNIEWSHQIDSGFGNSLTLREGANTAYMRMTLPNVSADTQIFGRWTLLQD
jgi:hypothetical protein